MAVLLLCVALVRPVAETGFMDDWSYVRTAELLARTGHVHYNGWATAMLGWPLFVAAGLIKLFGESFTVVRASNLLVAIATVALLHRLFLRVGCNSWNANLATVSVATCPIFLIGSVVFMSDMPGLLTVLLCCYACLRACQSAEHAAGWIAFAALSNAALGTCRQIAWLGVLVMVPSAMWLLRRQRAVLVSGVVSVATSVAFIVATMRWFNAQAYSVTEPLTLWARWHGANSADLATFLLRLALDGMLFMLPVAFVFAPFALRLPRGWQAAFLISMAGCLLALHHHSSHREHREWMSPMFLFEPAAPQSVDTLFTNIQHPFKGPSPAPLTTYDRLVLTGVSLAALGSFVGGLLYVFRRPEPVRPPDAASRRLAVLLIPYLICYVGLLLPRGLLWFTYDRYLLLLLPPFLLLVLPWYQRRCRARLPLFCLLPMALVALYSVASLHDEFAAYRTALALADEVRATGVPRTAIDAGWEYDHYTELLASGIVLQPGARLPNRVIVKDLHTSTAGSCSMDVPEWTPSLHPLYTLAYPGSACRPILAFAPVHYRAWLPPFHRVAYVAGYVPGSGSR